jgi:hypothetical protein
MPDAFPAVTSLLEVRFQREQYLERRLRPHVLVGAILDRLALLSFDGHRNHLVLEYARVPGLFRALLRSKRDFVHFLPVELVLLGEPLSGLGHRKAALRILERFPQEVFEGSGPQSEPPAGTAHHVRRLAHGFGAAREDRLGFAEHDELRALGDRLEPRAAEAVHRDRGDFDREARLEPDVAGAIDGISGCLQRVAEDRVTDLARRNARPVERVLPGHRAQLYRRQVLERAAERAEARADAGQKDDVGIGTLSFHGEKAPRETRGNIGEIEGGR